MECIPSTLICETQVVWVIVVSPHLIRCKTTFCIHIIGIGNHANCIIYGRNIIVTFEAGPRQNIKYQMVIWELYRHGVLEFSFCISYELTWISSR